MVLPLEMNIYCQISLTNSYYKRETSKIILPPYKTLHNHFFRKLVLAYAQQ